MDWFTADLHLYHNAIIKYTKRPFRNVNEMNKTLIRNWNKCIKSSDTIYILGDFVFNHNYIEKCVKQLNGQKHLVLGNHDCKRLSKIRHLFNTISDIKEIKIEGQHIVLSHYAMRSWNKQHHGEWQLFGHSHGTVARHNKYPSFDVGVDCWDYRPINFKRVKNYIEKNYKKKKRKKK